MGRLALVLVAIILSATACGSATSLRSATPVRNVVVYARPSHMSNRVALVSEPSTIYRARIDGTDEKRLATGSAPAVSPDGRFVAFGRGADVLVMPTAGGRAERVYTFSEKDAQLYAPTWAPDSRLLAFETRDALAVLDIRSHKVHVLPDNESGFSFSPDSRKVVYETGDDLYVVSALGGRAVRLTHDHKSSIPVWGKPGIAFSRYAGGYEEIWLRDGTTHHVRQLTHAHPDAGPVAFSADGKKLLAASWPSNSGRLWAVDVATGAEHPITPWVGELYPEALSAGGNTVLAVRGCRAGLYGKVETIPFAGGKPHVIALGPCSASWNAR